MTARGQRCEKSSSYDLNETVHCINQCLGAMAEVLNVFAHNSPSIKVFGYHENKSRTLRTCKLTSTAYPTDLDKFQRSLVRHKTVNSYIRNSDALVKTLNQVKHQQTSKLTPGQRHPPLATFRGPVLPKDWQ
jgi:hypothetical protein